MYYEEVRCRGHWTNFVFYIFAGCYLSSLLLQESTSYTPQILGAMDSGSPFMRDIKRPQVVSFYAFHFLSFFLIYYVNLLLQKNLFSRFARNYTFYCAVISIREADSRSVEFVFPFPAYEKLDLSFTRGIFQWSCVSWRSKIQVRIQQSFNKTPMIVIERFITSSALCAKRLKTLCTHSKCQPIFHPSTNSADLRAHHSVKNALFLWKLLKILANSRLSAEPHAGTKHVNASLKY